jgi:hypothetical protein
MSTTCLNCSAPVNENYCASCGQKVEVKRLTWHSLGEEIFHFFTHIEKGFLKTTGQLILHPGRLCKDYLDGKRKSYHKPVSFLLIWITLFLFTWYLADHFTHFENRYTSTLVTWDSPTLNVIQKYRSLVDILIIPVTAFFNWLIIGRPKLNYVEVLCISFYLFSCTFMFHIIHIIISSLLGINYKTNISEYITVGFLAIWGFWACYDFYKQYRVSFLLPRLLLWVLVAFITYNYTGKIIVKLLTALGF